MRIGLNPVVCWFTRDDASYEDGLTDMVRRFSRDARQLLYPGLPGCDPASLVTQALWSLQHKILDQYVPELKADKVRAVGCIWPWWEEIIVALPGGRLESLRPLPESDEQRHQLNSGTGGHFSYTFYRSDTPVQRRRWVLRMLKDQAKREKDKRNLLARRETEPDNSGPEPVGPAIDPGRLIDMERVREIVDTDDWKDALSDDDDVPKYLEPEVRARALATLRQRRCRATKRARIAGEILRRAPEYPRARTFLNLLRRTEDGQRAAVILAYPLAGGDA